MCAYVCRCVGFDCVWFCISAFDFVCMDVSYVIIYDNVHVHVCPYVHVYIGL